MLAECNQGGWGQRANGHESGILFVLAGWEAAWEARVARNWHMFATCTCTAWCAVARSVADTRSVHGVTAFVRSHAVYTFHAVSAWRQDTFDYS
jgi:hypothetical protein